MMKEIYERVMQRMTCSKAQSRITPFINDQLSLKETEEFIDHIEACPECREELEVYFALLTAMKQLDEDQDLSDDYNVELNAKLEKEQEKIIHAKYTYYRKKGILVFIILFVAFLFCIRATKPERKMVSESSYGLRVNFHQETYDYYEELLKQYLENQGID